MGEWERVRGRERVTRSVSRVDCPSLSGGPGGPGGRSHSESQSQFDRWTTTLTPCVRCVVSLSALQAAGPSPSPGLRPKPLIPVSRWISDPPLQPK